MIHVTYSRRSRRIYIHEDGYELVFTRSRKGKLLDNNNFYEVISLPRNWIAV